MEICNFKNINSDFSLAGLLRSNISKASDSEQINIWDKTDIKYPDTYDTTICYAIGTQTNMTERISAESKQSNEVDEIKNITDKYNLQVNQLIQSVRDNKITQNEFIDQMFDLTKNSLKEKIKLTIPNDVTNLNDEQKTAIENLFKTEGSILTTIITTYDKTGLNDDEKLAFIDKLQKNYGKLINEGLKELPNLDDDSREFYFQSFEQLRIPIDVAGMFYQGLLSINDDIQE